MPVIELRDTRDKHNCVTLADQHLIVSFDKLNIFIFVKLMSIFAFSLCFILKQIFLYI